VQQVSIAIKKKQRGIHPNLIARGQFQAFPAFHIHFDVQEPGVEKIAHRSVGESFGYHRFAGATPGRVGIEKNGFALGLGFGEHLWPGSMLELDALRGEREGYEEEEKKDVSHFVSQMSVYVTQVDTYVLPKQDGKTDETD